MRACPFQGKRRLGGILSIQFRDQLQPAGIASPLKIKYTRVVRTVGPSPLPT